jgi:hypothetical protein
MSSISRPMSIDECPNGIPQRNRNNNSNCDDHNTGEEDRECNSLFRTYPYVKSPSGICYDVEDFLGIIENNSIFYPNKSTPDDSPLIVNFREDIEKYKELVPGYAEYIEPLFESIRVDYGDLLKELNRLGYYSLLKSIALVYLDKSIYAKVNVDTFILEQYGTDLTDSLYYKKLEGESQNNNIDIDELIRNPQCRYQMLLKDERELFLLDEKFEQERNRTLSMHRNFFTDLLRNKGYTGDLSDNQYFVQSLVNHENSKQQIYDRINQNLVDLKQDYLIILTLYMVKKLSNQNINKFEHITGVSRQGFLSFENVQFSQSENVLRKQMLLTSGDFPQGKCMKSVGSDVLSKLGTTRVLFTNVLFEELNDNEQIDPNTFKQIIVENNPYNQHNNQQGGKINSKQKYYKYKEKLLKL